MLCMNRAKPLSRHIEFSWYSKLSYDHRLINERDARTLNNEFDERKKDCLVQIFGLRRPQRP